MQVLIDIPEEEFAAICYNVLNEREHSYGYVAIANGKPLPKGHGALKDADKLAIAIAMMRDKQYDWATFQAYDYCVDKIIDAPTIIEADEEVDE